MSSRRHAGASRIERPVILLGAPRSGTSLLASLVGAHPDVGLLREPRLVWRYGNDQRSDQLRPEHATDAVIAHIHRTFAAELAAGGAGRLVEKTPANAVRPFFVDAVFPDASYVHITRNGWAAVPSIRAFWAKRATGFDNRQIRKLGRRLREAHPSQIRHYTSELIGRARGATGRHQPLYGPRLAGLADVVDELGHLEAAALQWRTCVDTTTLFGEAVGPERYLQIRLEDLDVATLERVLDFCGLPRSEAVVEEFTASFRAEAGLRRAALSPEERVVVAPYIVPTNASLGYPEEATSEPGVARP